MQQVVITYAGPAKMVRRCKGDHKNSLCVLNLKFVLLKIEVFLTRHASIGMEEERLERI